MAKIQVRQRVDLMSTYYDEKKKKYNVYGDSGKQEFPEKPGIMDQIKEGFQDSNTRAQLEAIRRRKQNG